MQQIVEIVLPVFGLIGLGYCVAWWKVLSPVSGQGLADFVFVVAIPLLIFRTVATADFSGGSPWLLWIAYYIAFAIAWAAGTLIIRRLFDRDHRVGLVAGISASYSNALLVGIPLILTAYGNEGAAAISLLVAVHLPVMMAVSAILIERALVADGVAVSEARLVNTLKRVGRNLATNPIVLGLFAGILWRLVAWPLNGPLGTLVTRLADVASTLALFSVGMSLRGYGIRGHVRAALVLSIVKLVVMPAITFAVVMWLIPLPPAWAKSMVIAAACPTGVNAYLVAARFQSGEALASNAITLTTGLAVFTVAAWLHIVTIL